MSFFIAESSVGLLCQIVPMIGTQSIDDKIQNVI